MDLLFVYGTLLPGIASPTLAQLLMRFTPLGPATMAGTLYDLGPYPAAVPDPQSDRQIRGELFGAPDDPSLLGILDHYEGHFPDRPAQSLFKRTKVNVIRADGQRVHAWAYLWNRPVENAPLIPGGDYRSFRGV